MSDMRAIRGTFLIPLTQGKSAIVDADDWQWLSQWTWHIARCRHTFYAKRTFYPEARKRLHYTIRMHRVICNARDGDIVDHINGNGLDNRRSNLRLVSHAENCQNRPHLRSDNTSGATGIYERRPGIFRVHITRFGKRTWLGTFKTFESAVDARIKAETING